METKTQDYHISFFKPSSPRTKANRNMVIMLVIIWTVAIFGFQIVLKVIEEPTPEEAYLRYEQVWDQVKTDQANVDETRQFAQISLQVLSKVFITAGEREVLDKAFTSSVFSLLDESEQEVFNGKVGAFEKIKGEIDDIKDAQYIAAKNELSAYVSPYLGLSTNDVRTKILPLELSQKYINSFDADVKAQVPQIMEKYLIHNESALTRAEFLGFPFHYFYTAVFLLILFVFLCWLYCVRTDALNRKFDIED